MNSDKTAIVASSKLLFLRGSGSASSQSFLDAIKKLVTEATQ